MYDDEVSVCAYTYNDDDGHDGDGNGDVDADGDGDVEGEQGHLWFEKVKRKLPAQEVYIHTNNTTKHSFSAIPFIAHYPLCRVPITSTNSRDHFVFIIGNGTRLDEEELYPKCYNIFSFQGCVLFIMWGANFGVGPDCSAEVNAPIPEARKIVHKGPGYGKATVTEANVIEALVSSRILEQLNEKRFGSQTKEMIIHRGKDVIKILYENK
uniref:Uncharacterized protein n=1 Tax=Glossina pallidipes TaxID=7398 RepID=A0A1B0A2N9_GLOPL